MGGDPITIAAGAAVANAALGTIGAQQNNRAVRRSLGSAFQAATVESRQIALQGALERQQQVDEAQRVLGAIRVAAGSAGVSDFYAAEQQAVMDADRNQKVVALNTSAKLAGTASQYEATTAQIRSRYQSPLLSAIRGGAQGFSAGLSLGNLLGSTASSTAIASTGFDAPIQIPDTIDNGLRIT